MLQTGWQPVPGHHPVRPLGAGAFGEVWEAEREDGARFAFKFLDCRARSASMVASEVRMLRSLTALNHPHIVTMHGVHATGRYLVLMLERADGNLADLHAAYREEAGTNVPADHALDLLEQAALALDFMGTSRHAALPSSHGLQHCDVKPSNLLLFGDTLKVGDFGLCSGSGWHTHKGGWKGTLPYAAPELFNGAAVPGTDQYALAVTFCELVMGDRVFVSREATGMPIDMTRLREKEFPIISRALHPYPSSRWLSCQAFIQALRQALSGSRYERPPARVSPESVREIAQRRTGIMVMRTARDVPPPAHARR